MNAEHAQRSSFGALLRWLGGPLIWAAHFLLVYASESLLCSRGNGAHSHFLLIVAVSAVAIAILLAIIVRDVRDSRSASAGAQESGFAFMDKVGFGVALLSLIGVLWMAIPTMLIAACSLPV